MYIIVQRNSKTQICFAVTKFIGGVWQNFILRNIISLTPWNQDLPFPFQLCIPKHNSTILNKHIILKS